MRLLTHNQLICVVKGCEDNYPLKLTAKKVEQEESEFNPEFILGLLSHLNYQVLYNVACNDVSPETLLPNFVFLTAHQPAEPSFGHGAYIQALV